VAAIRHMALWRRLRTPPLALLLVAIALSLIRSRDQPGIDVGLGGTSAHVTPGDVALALLLVVSIVRLARDGVPRSARLAVAGGVLFCALVVVTAAINGTTELVSGVKLVELAVLALGCLALLRERADVEAIVDVLILFTIVADAVGLVKFIAGGGGRQSSFLGEHDFAALATLPLVYGLVLLYERRDTRRAWVSIVAGGIGCVLGAALASLLGLYLGVLALVAATAALHRLRARPTLTAAVVVALVTAGTLTIRAGDLGFLQSWFGKPPSRPGQYASSWSQRLIYTYVGLRVFVDHPLIGTGWYPLLPPKEFDKYLPAAQRRFKDQPSRYFPPPDRPFIPQQTFDQVPAELGLAGVAAFLALLAGAGRSALAAARRTTLAAGWLAATIGAIGGEALFGGTPLVATFFLVTGVTLALGAMEST
jgi:hypothetical protein